MNQSGRTQRRRRKGKKKPGCRSLRSFQTAIETKHFTLEGNPLGKKSGLLLGYQVNYGTLDVENDVEIEVTHNGRPSVIRTSLDRSKEFRLEVQRSFALDQVFFFGVGVLVDRHEVDDQDRKVFELIPQQQFNENRFTGSVISRATLNYRNFPNRLFLTTSQKVA